MNTNDVVRTAVGEQAASWFITNRAGSLDYAERAAFVAWLKASPIHVEEYLGVAAVARDLAAAADDPAVSLDSLLEQARADKTVGIPWMESPTPGRDRHDARTRGAGRWRLAAMAAAVSVAFAVLLGWAIKVELFAIPATYETARGEQGAWLLADGSKLRLNTESTVTVRYTRAERLVELMRGQAHFTVAHDTSRRFRVAAGEVEAIAVGTQFDVYRMHATTIVTVSEGKVAVRIGDKASGTGGRIPEHTKHVKAGYQLRIDAGVDSAQPMPVDLGQSLAWLQRKIYFEHRPLGEVVDELNRYAQVPLEIADPSLRALPISGVFDTDDMESFVAFLETLDGVRIVRTEDKVLVTGARVQGQGAAEQRR